MKKAWVCMVAMLLILAALGGCAGTGGDTQIESCRVLSLKEDGIVVWIEDFGNVYVLHVDGALEIKPLDTVVMKFSADDLEAADGEFTDCFGETQSYVYILDTPKSIRHNLAGEPTFG